MKNTLDAVQQFVSLRDSISAERENIIARLREIDAALGSAGLPGAAAYYQPRTYGPRTHNELSLKEAVLKVLEGGKSLTKHEILDAIVALGYTFTTNDPLNSLGVVLYGKSPKFKNQHGRFSI
jgi:hypothetical protein